MNLATLILTESKQKQKIEANRGDVAEAILGAAITAFFLMRPAKFIDRGDIDRVLDDYFSGKTTYKAKDFSFAENRIADTVVFRMALPAKAKEFISVPSNRQLVDDLYSSALAYVNSNDEFLTWALRLGEDDLVDEIKVLSDGTTDQKGTKADIKIFVNGEPVTKQISLKVEGGDQFAQFGGSSFDTQIKLFQESLGLRIAPLRRAYEQALEPYDAEAKFSDRGKQSAKMISYLRSAANLTYAEAYKQLTKIIDTKEFKQRLAEFIRKGATLNDPTIELVKLDKGTFKSQRFGKTFEESIQALELSVMFRPGESPMIIIQAKMPNDDAIYPLITLRAKFEAPSSKVGGKKVYGTYMRNYIEAPSTSALYKL